MADKTDSTTKLHGSLFHLRHGEKIMVYSPVGEVHITYEGKSRTRGNRGSIRVEASAGMDIHAGDRPNTSEEGPE